MNSEDRMPLVRLGVSVAIRRLLDVHPELARQVPADMPDAIARVDQEAAQHRNQQACQPHYQPPQPLYGYAHWVDYLSKSASQRAFSASESANRISHHAPSIHLLQTGDQLLRQALARLRPKQSRRDAAVLLHAIGEIHQHQYILFDVLRSLGVEIHTLHQERRVRPKIDADLPILLIGTVVKLRPVSYDAHHVRLFPPDRVKIARLLLCPQLPGQLKFIGKVIVQHFKGSRYSMYRSSRFRFV